MFGRTKKQQDPALLKLQVQYPAGFCNYRTAKGFGCAHVVLKDTERCPAGHDPRKTWSTKWTGSILDVRLSAAQPTEESWSGDVVSNPSAETEDLFVAQHPETSYRPFDYLGWLRGGGKDRELMDRLTSRGIEVRRVMRFVRDKSRAEMTMLSLLENGEIPESDARLVCDTYPGTGWHWDTEHQTWEQRIPIPELVRQATINYFLLSGDRPSASHVPFRSLPEVTIAAHMADEMQKLSKEMLGVEFRVICDPSGHILDSNRWMEGMPEGFLAIAAEAAIEAMPDDSSVDAITKSWLADSYDKPVASSSPGKIGTIASDPKVIALTDEHEGFFGLEGFPSIHCATRKPRNI